MKKTVLQLFPQSGECLPLQGLYLSHTQLAQKNHEAPTVYANFLTSMDGRIALKNENEDYYHLPDRLKSDEDFMLLLELYAHADCIITHGGYMRALDQGRLGNVLQLPDLPQAEYIRTWRQQQKMKPNPDVVIVSGSLDFPWHASLDNAGQNVHIATGGSAQSDMYKTWEQKGHHVHSFGDGEHVDVASLMSYLQQQGYQSIYLMAGPDLLEDMIDEGYVKHFFMTVSHQLLGGEAYKTLLNGRELTDKGRLVLENMYLDIENSNGLGQWYVEFSFSNN